MACAPVPARRRRCHSLWPPWCPEKLALQYGDAWDGCAHHGRVLEKLAHLEISYPMMFEVTNPRYVQRRLHCGVLEFIAQEGHILTVVHDVDLRNLLS